MEMKSSILILIVAVIGSGVAAKEYKLFPSFQVSWFEALDICESKGLKMATVDNDAENKRLVDLMKEKDGTFWLGATRLGAPTKTGKKDEYYWMGFNRLLNFDDFAEGEPNNVGNHEECVALWKGSGYKWNDATCTDKNFVACEKP